MKEIEQSSGAVIEYYEQAQHDPNSPKDTLWFDKEKNIAEMRNNVHDVWIEFDLPDGTFVKKKMNKYDIKRIWDLVTDIESRKVEPSFVD